ncbi:MAG: molecular chaperone [Pseudomonadota bacterium]
MFRTLKLGLMATTIALTGPAASAELMIAPTRIVLEKGERSAELVLVNKGAEQGAYRIGLENRRMLLNGSMEAIEEAREGEYFASDFVRFAPRRAVLEPEGRQSIRISANTSGLEPGEYRSHLRIMGAPTSAGRTLSEATSEGGDNISIELIAIRSITIPVIVRVGDLDAEVVIESAATAPSDEEGETILAVRFQRTGSASTYGDVQVFVPGQKEPVYFARGIAIYTPNTERDVMLPMPSEIAERLKGQDVRIAYISSDPNNPRTIAEVTAFIDPSDS